MGVLSANRRETIVRAIEPGDARAVLRLIDMAWRVYLRISPSELESKIKHIPSFLAEDPVGLRGFLIIEPMQLDVALIVGAGLRDTWGVDPFLDILLPKAQIATAAYGLSALVYIGNAGWLLEHLQKRGFSTREHIVAFERMGTTPPPVPARAPAQLRTAHYTDLPTLLTLDKLAFGNIWHKTPGNFSEALAGAVSFTVALIDGQIVAYEWCEIYKDHAHLTRLAVHPDYQGQGLGAQLLHRAITDALAAGANLITLNTQENNQRSHALYKRFGFVDTKQRIPVMWQDLG